MKRYCNIQRIFCVVLVALTLCALVGCGDAARASTHSPLSVAVRPENDCGVQIHLYEQQDEDIWYFLVEFAVTDSLRERLESTATLDSRGKKWTVESWLNKYMEIVAENEKFTCTFDGVYTPDANKESNEEPKKGYDFILHISKTEAGERIREGLTLKSDYAVRGTNLFVRTVDVERADRFNYWQQAFKEVYARYSDPTKPQEPMDYQTATGILLFGTQVNGFSDFPGIADAFPSANVKKWEDVLLCNYWYGSRKMNVACDGMQYVQGGRYYLFRKYAGDGDTTVQYEYYVADPTGWYIVAIAGAGIAIGIVFLVLYLRKRKQNKPPKQKVEDMFPYNPFNGY